MATKSIAWATGNGNITLIYQGYGDGDITVSSDPNNLDTARSQVINIETTAGSPAVVKNFTVSQGACPFPVGDVRNFAYTSNVQSVVLPAGTYKLQCWGAQGGSNAAASSYGITAKAGGKGGYSEGIITLSAKTTVRIYVGGAGSSSAGGFNGGGSTSGSSSYSSGDEYGVSRMGGGGGASDIRLSDGALLSRMIVAGGGAGGAMCYKKVTTESETYTTITYTAIASTAVEGVYQAANDFTMSSGHRYTLQSATSSSGGTIYGENILVRPNYTRYDGRYLTSNTPATVAARSTIQGDTIIFVIREYTKSSSTSTYNESQVGGVGGGTQGGAYSSSYAGKQNAAGSGGSFGQGANQTTTNYRYCSGAGGGGWYGGGGGSYSDSSMSTVSYSGGGSGFVNTAASAGNRPSGYTGLQLDSGTTYAGDTSFPSTSGGTETGHSGNGYARITRIAAYSITLRFKDEEDSPVTGASVTVSNSENTYSLTTDSNGEATATMQNGTYNLSCSGYSVTPSQITVSSNSTIDVVAEAPSIMDFSYTGAVQNATLRAGTYKIECWGAQGGYRSSSSYGGKGGYSTGTLNLTQETTIYVYVGGSGNTGGTSGGFNGGGKRYSYVGGGGASDVRISQDSLYARVIVAGGGGSDGATSRGGGAGGGTNGQNTTASSYGDGGYGGGASVSSPNTGGTSYFAGINATQPTSTSPTTQAATYNGFGWGGSGSYRSSGYGGAGGGGWFGGVGTYPDGSGDDDKGGGGGSGYVYTSSTASNYPSGCLLDSSMYLTDASTIVGTASMPSTSGSTETGHSGNGYVRITKI